MQHEAVFVQEGLSLTVQVDHHAGCWGEGRVCRVPGAIAALLQRRGLTIGLAGSLLLLHTCTHCVTCVLCCFFVCAVLLA